ncbi:MAG: hypothetical protein ACP5N2_04775 [Candidatus Nanoarchaeia archaeon]
MTSNTIASESKNESNAEITDKNFIGILPLRGLDCRLDEIVRIESYEDIDEQERFKVVYDPRNNYKLGEPISVQELYWVNKFSLPIPLTLFYESNPPMSPSIRDTCVVESNLLDYNILNLNETNLAIRPLPFIIPEREEPELHEEPLGGQIPISERFSEYPKQSMKRFDFILYKINHPPEIKEQIHSQLLSKINDAISYLRTTHQKLYVDRFDKK